MGEAPAAQEMFACAECGKWAKADEDGCCTICGADCVVTPAASSDPSLAQRLEALEDRVSRIDLLDGESFTDRLKRSVRLKAQLSYAEPTPNSETESALQEAQKITARQTKDPSLWFKPLTGTEVRFQKALLELHQVIDGDDFLGNIKLAEIVALLSAKPRDDDG